MTSFLPKSWDDVTPESLQHLGVKVCQSSQEKNGIASESSETIEDDSYMPAQYPSKESLTVVVCDRCKAVMMEYSLAEHKGYCPGDSLQRHEGPKAPHSNSNSKRTSRCNSRLEGVVPSRSRSPKKSPTKRKTVAVLPVAPVPLKTEHVALVEEVMIPAPSPAKPPVTLVHPPLDKDKMCGVYDKDAKEVCKRSLLCKVLCRLMSCPLTPLIRIPIYSSSFSSVCFFRCTMSVRSGVFRVEQSHGVSLWPFTRKSKQWRVDAVTMPS
eukprot:m.116293 g.116293  ORF g.116293 m.116293 type:complete len:267 (+) comp12850_c1_seq2:287-1087(+)